MSKSTIEVFIDAVHARLAERTESPLRATAPYYVYGSQDFFRGVERPPQVRYRLTSFELSPSRVNANWCRQGDFATWEQTVECSVWGTDENETINEAQALLLALHEESTFRGYPLPNGGSWVSQESEGAAKAGEMVIFSFVVPLGMSIDNTDSVTILTASFGMSSSSGPLTGSLFSLSGSAWVTGSILSSSL